VLGGLRIRLLCGISITLEVMCSVYGCRGASARDLPVSAAYFVAFPAISLTAAPLIYTLKNQQVINTTVPRKNATGLSPKWEPHHE
jgi:hypothetical protein